MDLLLLAVGGEIYVVGDIAGEDREFTVEHIGEAERFGVAFAGHGLHDPVFEGSDGFIEVFG